MKNFYYNPLKEKNFRCKDNQFATKIVFIFAVILLLSATTSGSFAQSDINRTTTVNSQLLQPGPDSLNTDVSDTTVNPAMGEHAPSPDDPDFVTKKEVWIKNYPDEYKAFQNSSNTTAQEPVAIDEKRNDVVDIEYNESELSEAKLDYLQEHDTLAYQQYLLELEADRMSDSLSKVESDSAETRTPEKAAEHAPLYTDPDYAEKKAEWVEKYPDEYESINKYNTESDYESRQDYLESIKDSEPVRYLEELGRLKNSMPEFYFRHLEWLKSADPALYKKVIKSN